ncbi:hypothetical protein HRbin37_01326 [bacterium HR37]|jgi:hypothetical protein|nr:hypothetical protein HRbin37_01326 [bacterium HR37]
MSTEFKEHRENRRVYLGDLDEFLAALLLEENGRAVKISVGNEAQGFVDVCVIGSTNRLEDSEGVDFELSPCECLDLEVIDVSSLFGKNVFTSSAYELFDFLLSFFDRIECIVDFSGNAWKIKITRLESPE